IGSTVYAYVRGVGEPWNLIFTGGPQTGEGIPQFGLSAQGDTFSHEDGSVAVDDFRLNSGALTCPNWWQDLAPGARCDPRTGRSTASSQKDLEIRRWWRAPVGALHRCWA